MEYTPNQWLMKYYHHLLLYSKEGEQAKEYLIKRGITEETIKKFALGYSPRNEKMTLEFLKSKGFKLEALTEQKILTRYRSGKKEGQIGDLFSGRITIPITDFKGDVVAFGGRSIRKNEKIKYINSPSNEKYVKGDNLFGFSHAEKYIRKKGFVILVEGYFDFLQVYQAGFKNVVAVLGVALTPSQALLLKSVTNNAVVTFDGDSAGREASFKIGKMLKQVGFNVKITDTKEGNDPDDFIRANGISSFVQLLKHSQPYINSLISYYTHLHNNLQSPIDRFLFTKEVLNHIPDQNITERKKVLSAIAKTQGQSLKILYDEMVKRGL